ncbi:uncharacterized protein [Drosophila tropicalis]|uniref:uncharacterized protein n=1 Tax=Drosophila tropicalis TaxID=46794 RepID=UPI0035ABB7EC
MQETALPAWLTKSYLQPKLRSFYQDDKLQILKLCSNAATAKGENYVGVMTRVHVEFTDGNGGLQKKTYVLKEACPTDAPQAKLFAEYNVYTREMDMYEFVLPKMAELLKEVGLTEKLHADAVCVDRELCIMLLEDLSPLKYTNTDRIKQMDLEHTKLTLEMLAKFHAASTVLKQRYPEVLDGNFSTGFFSRGVTGYKKLFFHTLQRTVAVCKVSAKTEFSLLQQNGAAFG